MAFPDAFPVNAPLLPKSFATAHREAVPLPAFVQIEPVGRCNLHCAMCPVHLRADAAPPALMDFDAFTRLLDGFGANLRTLHLQGLGEPLMHPRFFDMVRTAAQRGIEVSTNSNLTLLTQRRAQEAVGCGLREISVSIDAPEEALFASIRVGARLPRVLRNLERLLRARGTASTPRVRIVMVLMRRNLASLEAMVELAARTGVDGLFVQRLSHDFAESTLPDAYRPMRRFIDAELLGEADAPAIETAYALARASATRLGLDVRLPRATPRDPNASAPRCDWPWRGAYLSHAGESMPCCMVATPERAKLGNMIRDGVEATWNGEAYAQFRAGLAADAPAEVCRGCALYRGTF